MQALFLRYVKNVTLGGRTRPPPPPHDTPGGEKKQILILHRQLCLFSMEGPGTERGGGGNHQETYHRAGAGIAQAHDSADLPLKAGELLAPR